MADCFISYHHRQRDWARELSVHLEQFGVHVYFDQNLRVGDSWPRRLQKFIQQSRLFILLTTPESMASRWVRREIDVALVSNKNIFNIKLQDTPIPPLLQTIHHFDLTNYNHLNYRSLLLELTSHFGLSVPNQELQELTLPHPPVILLPSRIHNAMVSVVEPLCESEYIRKGLASSTHNVGAEALEEFETPQLQASALIIQACDNPSTSPLVIAKNLLSSWAKKGEGFNLDIIKGAVQLINQELRTRIEAAPTNPHLEVDERTALYRQWLEKKTRHLQLGAIQSHVEDAIELNDIYIQERGVYSYTESNDKSSEQVLLRREIFLINAVEAALNHCHNALCLLGPAGSGKTTTMRQLAGCILRGDARISKSLHNYLPLFLPLKFVPPKMGSLSVCLDQYYKREGQEGVNQDFFHEHLESGMCLVMLDGLDEVSDRATRYRTVEWIDRMRRKYPNNFYFLTCRDHVYRDHHTYFDKDFLRIDIQGLSPNDIINFIRIWYQLIADRVQLRELYYSLEDPRKEADRLSEVLARREELIRLAANPLMLQIMAMINLISGAIPQSRSDLYRECILILAYRWDEMRGIAGLGRNNEEDILQLLENVARWLHGEEGRTQAPKNDVINILNDPEKQEKGLPANAPHILGQMLERGALISEVDNENVGFKHLAFQEYLVASSFLAEGDYAFLAQRLNSPWWREVIFLLLSHRRPSPFSQFMRELIGCGSFKEHRELVLECIRAAEGTSRPPNVFVNLLLDQTASFEARYNAILALREVGLSSFRNKLQEALSNDSSSIGEIGRLLLGIEQNAGVNSQELPTHWQDPLNGMQYVLVPEGDFDMGSREESAASRETPAESVYLRTYYIAIHPVTNKQYRKFIQETGHYTPAGRDWWNLWIGDKYPPGMDNHPVVFVSWYEAMRYCEWAKCTLPTEAQWEKAARGTDGRIFPWPDDRQDFMNLMNFNSNIGRTTEVGLYPDGISPYGCLDMAGNVWEWCLDWFSFNYWNREQINPTGPPQGTRRIDRGGGWQMDARRCRAAYRGEWPPSNPDRDLGFRTVISVERVVKG